MCGFLKLLLHRFGANAVLLRRPMCRSRKWLKHANTRSRFTCVHMFDSVRGVLRRFANIAARGLVPR